MAGRDQYAETVCGSVSGWRFYLTAGEKKLLAQVEEVYDKIVVVLNIGGVIDLSWIKRDDKIGAALYGGQGGMEGGTAMAQVLCGLVNPSGKLADTFAARLEDYPSTENFHESVEYVDYTEDRLVSVLVRILTRFYVRR